MTRLLYNLSHGQGPRGTGRLVMPGTTDPLLRHAAAPLHGVFHPLGFRLEIETNDQRVLDAAESSYGVFRPKDHQDEPLRLRVLCIPDSKGVPPWPQHTFRAYRDWFTIVGSAENYLAGDLQSREGIGFFSSAFLDCRDYFTSIFLDAFTYMSLQRHWMTPFHAAAVVRNGRAVCLSGNTRAGKSTLAYACVKAGYSLLTDNSAFMLNAGTSGRLRGNPSRLNLRLSARNFFPELAGLPVSYRDDPSAEPYFAVPTRQMFPNQLVTEAEPGPIVFLKRPKRPLDTPMLEDVAPEIARQRLFDDRNPAVDEPHVMEETKRVLGNAVQFGAYQLQYSTLDLALECLDKIAWKG